MSGNLAEKLLVFLWVNVLGSAAETQMMTSS